MNRDELRFIGNLHTEEEKHQVEEEITTLYELGFNFIEKYVDSYLHYSYTGQRNITINIYVRNMAEYVADAKHVSVWTNCAEFCEADTLEQALKKLME